ncbi:MAG: hypothetical protein KKE11_00885 [Gammaproteobacteria bacterium]|nr:hypothetical protein [Gammaproteobacteria bacterium]
MRNKLLMLSMVTIIGIIGCSKEESTMDESTTVPVDAQQQPAAMVAPASETNDANAQIMPMDRDQISSDKNIPIDDPKVPDPSIVQPIKGPAVSPDGMRNMHQGMIGMQQNMQSQDKPITPVAAIPDQQVVNEDLPDMQQAEDPMMPQQTVVQPEEVLATPSTITVDDSSPEESSVATQDSDEQM